MDLTSKLKQLINYADSFVKYFKNRIMNKRSLLLLLGALLFYKLNKFPLHISSSEFMKLVNESKIDSVCYLGFLLCFKMKNSSNTLLTNYATNNIDTFNEIMTTKNIHFNHFRGYESLMLNPYNQLFALTALFSYVMMDNLKDYFIDKPKSNFLSKERSLSSISKVFDNIITSKVNKDQFILTIDQLLNPEKYKFNRIKPVKGILLYGKPGTGKTLVAKVNFYFLLLNLVSFKN